MLRKIMQLPSGNRNASHHTAPKFAVNEKIGGFPLRKLMIGDIMILVLRRFD